MTADDFTEAARAEAEALFLNSAEVPSPQDIGEHIAEWARTHLAAQEPTDGERAVREPHGQAWNGTLDYCRRCLDYEGAIYPCSTIQALDSARAARRDEEKRDG
ncbi:hypothetical protein [Brachybacterium sp. GPGPB12]|uniref:hypothetical protein n=1 Tax=Brachybacterium sp. GPGPB12 TaxID=3023517 RepID=UPI0031345586